MSDKDIAKDRADWLLDAVACATQNRQFLRGDPAYDEVAGEAILLNGEKAINVALSKKDAEITRLRAALSDAQVVGFAAGVEAAATLVATHAYTSGSNGMTLEPSEMARHDMHHHTIAKGIRALTPPDLTAAAARVLLADDAAAHALCAAFVNGLRERSIDTPPYDGWSQKDKDETAGFMQKGLRAIAGDTP